MRRWINEISDIRKDEDTNQKIVEFLELHQVQSVAMTEGIIGCPHEESIDYPEGKDCPQCEYWKGRDRFSGKVRGL